MGGQNVIQANEENKVRPFITFTEFLKCHTYGYKCAKYVPHERENGL